MNVGFIGLGNMGKAIATNMLRAGHQLRVWNRSPAPARELAELGAEVAANPADAARAEVLVSMLPDDTVARSVLLGQGVLEAAPSGLVHVNMATVSIGLVRELTEMHRHRGLKYLAAPVFGRPDLARAGKLNTVVAGDAASIARVEPLLLATSARVWPAGEDPARANAIKLAGNFMIACALESMGEAAALVHGYGVSAHTLLEILASGLFAAPVYQIYGSMIAAGKFEPPGFKLTLGFKDVRLALEAARAVHVPLRFGSVLNDNFLEALASGHGELDWAAVARVPLRQAGFERSA
jgi:3-hydroxyisobutyrate dehydrogenase-like beta-hydroxyacid dehydrogenase